MIAGRLFWGCSRRVGVVLHTQKHTRGGGVERHNELKLCYISHKDMKTTRADTSLRGECSPPFRSHSLHFGGWQTNELWVAVVWLRSPALLWCLSLVCTTAL